jgi:3-deoxy-D-manno-octulosonic acid (KDO) 8-phosphate synthase
VDGVFLEVHKDPEQARCDGPNSLPIADMENVVRVLLAIHGAVTAQARAKGSRTTTKDARPTDVGSEM